MSQVRVFRCLSWVALATSLIAVAASLSTEWSGIIPLLMWNHVLIIVIFAAAIFKVHKLPKLPLSDALRSFPRWLIAVGVGCLILAAPNWSESKFDLGKMDTGEQVTRKNWYVEGDKYFLKLNNSITKEISKAEYEELQRESFEFFARGWVIFSFACVAFWYYIGRRTSAPTHAS